MSLNISSDRLTDPLLKPILIELTMYFKQAGISFFIIGATARDIVMEINGEKSGRLTFDLDIAISVNDWDQWQKVEEDIVNLDNFTKDKVEKQRFLYKGSFQLDIVPFGDIMGKKSKIFWPPDETMAMSVLGFKAAEKASLKLIIDHEIELKAASLGGLFLLKITAWKERHLEHNKDADDIGFILENYLNINAERAAANHYDEIYTEDFTIVKGGATLLGIDVAKILEEYPEDLNTIKQILIDNVEMQEQSVLINQILETNRTMSYNEVLDSLKNIFIQLK